MLDFRHPYKHHDSKTYQAPKKGGTLECLSVEQERRMQRDDVSFTWEEASKDYIL